MLTHSRKLADGLLARADLDDTGRIREAYERSLSRPPRPDEIDAALTFISRVEQQWQGDKAKAWQSFCKALLATNEFVYIN
jgi:hypothetical protein